MPSELGRRIREARLKSGVGLRELARRIEKSPGYIVQLERLDIPPGVSEGTLAAIASELGLALDSLMTSASKLASELTPKTPLEVALYRRVRQLTPQQQLDLKRKLDIELGITGYSQEESESGEEE